MSNELYRINPASGAATLLGRTDFGFLDTNPISNPVGLTFTIDGKLLASGLSKFADATSAIDLGYVLEIDPTNAMLIGGVNTLPQIFNDVAQDWDTGAIFGSSGSELSQFNFASLSSNVIGSYGISDGGVNGLAILRSTSSVPEPAGSALILGGLFGLSAARRCKNKK